MNYFPFAAPEKSQTVNDHEVLDVDLGDIGDFIFGWFMKEVVKEYNLIKFLHQWTDQYN